MSTDREVLRLVWEGQIPVCFQVDPDEIDGLQQPERFYLIISRLSYLPLVTEKVRKHFMPFVPNEAQDGEVWFDCNGIPLKWHYPIGVLYELTANGSLPWCLTMHFSNFPEEVLIRSSNKEVVEAHFMSCLKEADVLKHRGQVMSAMQKKDHNQLWLGLINDKFDQFWAVNRRLMEANGEQEAGFKHIPIRCYNEDGTYDQKLIQPLGDGGRRRTVEDLLGDFSTPVRKAVSMHTHGISVAEQTPLQWLSEHLSYPDNFLHMCIRFEATEPGDQPPNEQPDDADAAEAEQTPEPSLETLQSLQSLAVA